MIALHHNTAANVLLVVEWLTAFIGICVSIGTAGVGISNQATNLVEVGTWGLTPAVFYSVSVGVHASVLSTEWHVRCPVALDTLRAPKPASNHPSTPKTPHSTPHFTKTPKVLIFLAMGCAAFGIWGQLVVSVPLPALRLLVAGGLTYIFGIPFFIYGEASPFGLFKRFYVSWGTGLMVGGGGGLTHSDPTHTHTTQRNAMHR